MIVAREKEAELLRPSLEDEYSQFIAVYGRRRVGKTFLVRESFGYDFAFQHAGLAEGGLREQLFAFSESLRDAGLTDFTQPTSWLEAFSLLKELVRRSATPCFITSSWKTAGPTSATGKTPLTRAGATHGAGWRSSASASSTFPR